MSAAEPLAPPRNRWWQRGCRWLGQWLLDRAAPPRPEPSSPTRPERSHRLLTHLVDTSPDIITLTELSTGRYALVNPSFERIIGYPASEVIGRTSLELGIWADLSDRKQLLSALRIDRTVQNLPARFRARDGQLRSMLLSAARFTLNQRDYLVVNARDVSHTEQTRLELQTILENAMIGIAMTRNQRFVMTNPRMEQMLGWPAGELMGQHASQVWPSAEEHQAVGREVRDRLEAGQQVEIERMLRRHDGSLFLCRLLAKAVDPAHPSQSGTIWLAEDVTEQRRLTLALAKACGDAEAANQAKSAILANTSHELRTPLNALLGLARLARQPGVDDLRRRAYIEQISDSAETLSTIIGDILDMSRIEAGKLHVDRLPFRLADLLKSLSQAYGALADAQGVQLNLHCDPTLPELVLGDAVRLRQILSNFLNNALKFTPAGRITLSVRRVDQERLLFEVVDTGIGIAPADQPGLFQPFAQVDTRSQRPVGGTGLGLSICRHLAELMGGEVGLRSRLHVGSCFWAQLPLPDASQAQLDESTGTDGMDPLRGAKVLMVEDNPVNMMIAVALLEQWGAEVVQATGGRAAIAAVDQAAQRGSPFDVVLMDLQMPGMSGHEATRELRQRHPAHSLPIIALTAAALGAEREQALSAGMNDFLTKPIDAMRLRATLVRTLRQAPP